MRKHFIYAALTFFMMGALPIMAQSGMTVCTGRYKAGKEPATADDGTFCKRGEQRPGLEIEEDV